RKVGLEQLTAAHDDEHLLICGTCRLVYLHDNHHCHCRHCETDLLDWPDRHQAAPLPERLESIKRRLAEQAAQAGGHTSATSSRTSAAHPHDRETPAPPFPKLLITT